MLNPIAQFLASAQFPAPWNALDSHRAKAQSATQSSPPWRQRWAGIIAYVIGRSIEPRLLVRSLDALNNLFVGFHPRVDDTKSRGAAPGSMALIAGAA
jgi:hypothetical protein